MNTIEPLAITADTALAEPQTTEAYLALRDSTVKTSQLVTQVSAGAELESASLAMRSVKEIIDATEALEAKKREPVNKWLKEIRAFRDSLLAPLCEEHDRVKKLADAYNTREFHRKQKEERELADKARKAQEQAAAAEREIQRQKDEIARRERDLAQAELSKKQRAEHESKLAAAKEAQQKAELAAETAALKTQSVETALAAPTNTPKGMSVRVQYDFQILNFLSFVGSFPIYAKEAEDKRSAKLDVMAILRDLNDVMPNPLNKLLPREEQGETEARMPGHGLRIYLDIDTRTRR